MKVTIKQIENYMLSRIDRKNLVEVDKVNRYIRILSFLKELEEDIANEGLTTTVENGAQRFSKSNPSSELWIKYNKELDKLESSINFEIPQPVEKKKGEIQDFEEAKKKMLGRL